MSLLLLLKTAPASAIPHVNSKSYKLLALLAKGDPVPEVHILIELGGNNRSQLQALKGEQYEYWNIINERNDKGIIVSRSLDPRHVSGNPKLDARARAERRLQLASDSLKQAINEQARASKAFAEWSEAEAHLEALQKENAPTKKVEA